MFAYLLIRLFIGAFVDWILSFKRYKTISGAKLAEIAEHDVRFDADVRSQTNAKRRISSIWIRARRVFVLLISLLLTLAFAGGANVVADKVIDSLVEFQQRSK